MRSSTRVVIELIVFLVTVPVLVLAQSGTTSLRGTVTDASGAAISGAKITLSSAARGFDRAATTGASGGYEFLQLQPGTYQLTTEMSGFRKSEQKDVQLLVDTPATVNVKLEVGAATEVVEVTGEAATINTADASIGNAFSEVQVRELPMEGRNVPDLLTLQAGVTYLGNRESLNEQMNDSRNGAVNGAHSDQTNITLDGTDVNDQVNGYAFASVLPVTLDSMQEFRVTTTNYGADAGRSSGAQVSLVTKSGTNSFHGSLYEYLRNTYTSANDYFVKSSQAQSGSPNLPPKLIRNIFGGSVGGPILKNRLYFFANYEAARQREEESDVRIVPSAALRQGVVEYQCAGGSAACPGQNPVAGTTVVTPPGVYGVNLNDLQAMDPHSIGADSVICCGSSSYFGSNFFPASNDPSVGDTYNFLGYRFKGAVPTNRNWYIARLDYKITQNGNHTLFWRGALRNDNRSGAPYLPGTPPLTALLDYSKGFTVGYTATLRPTLLNNFHWGYTRQSWGQPGNNDSTAVIFFRGLNDNSTANNSSEAVTRGEDFRSTVQNFTDDVSWSKGKHTIQFGTNLRFIRSPRNNFINSFPNGVTNVSALDTAGFANKPSPFSPGDPNFAGTKNLPAVDPNFNNQYDYPTIALLGMVTQYSASFNFQKNGTALPLGAPVSRHWGFDEYEFYIQDSYRMKPNLTVNLGLRYSLFSPPWETTGTEVAPTISMGQWFKQRQRDMLSGIGSNADPTVTFNLAGAANGKAGYYGWDYHNFAPKISFAYTPRPDGGWLRHLVGDGDKTVIRGGAGIAYDHIGPGLLTSFDQNGSFGLSTQLTNSVLPTASNAPRLTSLTSIPTTLFDGVTPFAPATPSGGFPYTPPPSGTGLGIYWGLDDKIKTPYSYTLDLSVGRELSKGLSLEVSYVGRLSHRLLAQEDLAMPLDLVDKKSGVAYFAAANRLSQLAAQGTPTSNVNAALVGPTAAYWQNMIAPLVPGDQYNLSCSGNVSGGGPYAFTTDPVQAVYDLYSCFNYNETTALSAIDYAGSDFNQSGVAGIAGMTPGLSGCTYSSTGNPCSLNHYPTVLGPNAYFNSQFHSLYAWRSIGNANYHAMQVSLRKRMSHGLQFDLNYTYSHAIDLSSAAERVQPYNGVAGGISGNIINSWVPNQQRGTSDFDTTHQLNTNFIFELPFGKGKYVARNSGGVADAIIGGWSLSGLARWTSGFPLTIGNGGTWPTNWQLGGAATQIGPAHTGVVKQSTTFPNQVPNLFTDPNGPTGIHAFRHDYPGESGGRSQVRGPGFAGLDAALSKAWKMPYSEAHLLKFRWEVFNVLNHPEFDVNTVTNNIDQQGSFGNFSGLLTNPRVMQFALRYEF
jgi:hypothetical protein